MGRDPALERSVELKRDPFDRPGESAYLPHRGSFDADHRLAVARNANGQIGVAGVIPPAGFGTIFDLISPGEPLAIEP